MANLTKPLFNNGMDEKNLNAVVRGFLLAVVDDAEHNLRDSSAEEEGLPEEDYAALCDCNFGIRNISTEAVRTILTLVHEFCSSPTLNKEQMETLNAMDTEAQVSFGMNLCHALIYDSTIIDDVFRDAVENFRSVDETGKIGLSVEDDYRVFFE